MDYSECEFEFFLGLSGGLDIHLQGYFPLMDDLFFSNHKPAIAMYILHALILATWSCQINQK